jgi:hypothetical protein
MKRILSLACLALAAARCASSPPAASPAPEPVTPADFVASIADVAAGRNPSLAETGLVLTKIEFHLVVGTATKGGGKIGILVLDAEAARSSETTFLQELTLEIPKAPARRLDERPLVPGVREFVETAMNTARDLARAAAAAGLPQQLTSVELTAKIARSRTLAGGITATIPVWVRPSIGGELSRKTEQENTVRMVFARN